MSPLLVTQPFEIANLQNLSVGRALPSLQTGYEGPTMVKGAGWSLPSGAYTARQIVEGCAPLLETVLYHLGPSPSDQPSARDMLLDNLASNLALGTRESSLDIPTNSASRKEFAAQAVKIGKTLVTYARETKDVAYDSTYAIRSPCEGHLLKPPVAQLMFGPRSLGHLMQIYNEYLHQMVLLRDALLPFENYDQVIIPITGGKSKQQLGMRFTEPQRASFIAELMTKLTTQKSVFKVGQQLLAPNMPSDIAYGFQYKYGIVLPAAVVGGQSLRLLRYIPSVIDETTPEVTFEYEFADYYSAPRVQVPQLLQRVEKDQTPVTAFDAKQHGLEDCSFAIATNSNSSSTSRILQLLLSHRNGQCSAVDVGQISRGWRYSYKVSSTKGHTPSAQSSAAVSVHSASEFLASSEEEQIGMAFGTLFSTEATTTCRLDIRKIVLQPTDDNTEDTKVDPKGPVLEKKKKKAQNTSTDDVLQREFPSSTSINSQSSKKKPKLTDDIPPRTTRAKIKSAARSKKPEDEDE
ncbi:unnamed protein product [Aureobasidium mustum]|uniref:Uncharacterized protein n=1 Tax=Aureobasidium mustum TaxID=2773714 RepID=A0A9N8PIC4_9PEZI|nr:unnamed protein product [Aureobasidium mustum]